ncbi:hydantoinase/oxoprolinase family protein [Natronomonas sp.]|uniref:hydantoinase/oxoprolinase family protein n=1 Tax=Natronomonas sp. TaxID=2184060 RepID=UPI002FC32243
MRFLCNVDIGGTHTDIAVIDEDGNTTEAKVQSTPGDFAQGFFDSLDAIASELGINTTELLESSDLVSHGTTVGTNAVIEGEESETALVTTRGTEDVLFLMRGAPGRTSGLPIEEVLRYQHATKPDPIIPKHRVHGINERVDSMGDVVVEFDEQQARDVAQQLAEEDIDSVAVSFLWSFLESDHEERMTSILEEELDDDVFLTQSNQLVPKWGEYERTTAVAINASIGPVTSEYITDIDEELTERGYDGKLLVMQVGGGVAPAADAIREPVRTIDSGPAAGMIGCSYLADHLEHEDIIAADMGGTSFDVGLITDGEPLTNATNVINRYDYAIRNIDIDSIGNGGGSIAWVDEDTGRLEVGPQSAGADPGPACYGEGGSDPTITDADLLLGFLDADEFLAGRMSLDVDRAESAIEELADTLGMGVTETASGIVEIANAQMADLVGQRTINRGYDPRNFVMYAYGGAGPMHMAAVADQLDIGTVVVPGGSASSVWSALGISSSDVLHRNEVSNIRTVAPFDPDEVTRRFEDAETEVREKLADNDFADEQIRIERYADLRYGAQVHQIPVPMPGGTLDESDIDDMIRRFEQKYEELYGEGAGASESGFELVAVRVDGYGETTKPQLEQAGTDGGADPAGTAEVYWPRESRRLETEIYYDEDVGPGGSIDGPAVVRMENTTIAVPPNDTCEIDSYSNFNISIGGN